MKSCLIRMLGVILPLIVLVSASAAVRAAGDSRNPPRRPTTSSLLIDRGLASAPYRLPAEFERQQGILLSASGLVSEFSPLFLDLIDALRPHVSVYLLASHGEEEDSASAALRERGIPPDSIRFFRVPHDSIWVRDYGPFVVEDPLGRRALVDARYDTPGRDRDEKASFVLSDLLGLPLVITGLQLEGGNLLTNGRGLFITTTKVLDLNRPLELTEQDIRDELNRVYGAVDVVFLEPVRTEPTGHVDAFATFISENTLVVASCDPERDPRNAALLDRNAGRLAKIRTARGPLRIIRIPTPHHPDGIWRTYANVLYANEVVLVPVYRGIDEEGRRATLKTFRDLLPKRKVIGIDASGIVAWDGALHCISMNLSAFKRHVRWEQN